MAKGDLEIKLKIVIDVQMSDEIREFFNLPKEEVGEPQTVELEEVDDPRTAEPKEVGDPQTVELEEHALRDLCSAHDIGYYELLGVIDSAIQTGSYMIYIDLDQYRASRLKTRLSEYK